MSSSLDARERHLYAVVDEVLHYLWDPIGVAGVPQARGEYQSCVPQVFSLLVRGASELEIAEFMSALESDRMGLTPAPERARQVVSILLNWRDLLADESAELPIRNHARSLDLPWPRSASRTRV